ncbi:SGNH/GDSL hydrolase family protein [Nocardia goodfellowii]|uniref:Lysophospholipase L1-like esterase n=1 Tax=Nocardia goodfellowii TaxID=882446 RepID=A0ABS4QN05_9NOCA|nr:SGNH/GDSL hydrolase family protein [Nocardia goodfellowii]MBP2192056.1 lysophospholipase L1-like esterase [Nocardia goodfellowii]
MKKTSLALFVCVAVGFGTVSAVAPTAEAVPAFSEYVALGDSWAADVTLNPSTLTAEFTPVSCLQSRSNYARQVAAALAVPEFRDASCGGAVTDDMTRPQVSRPATGNPPQFDQLSPSTDLVTVLIGGNDAGLAAAVLGCITADPAATPCLTSFTAGGVDRMSAAIALAEPKVGAVLRGIRERSPKARILLLNYFEIVGVEGGCFPEIPISDGDAVWLGHRLIELNAMLARVARINGVEHVDTYAGSHGHDACQPPGVRWGEGLVPLTSDPAGPAVPFHPNQLGSDHQARSVLTVLGR